MERAFYSEAMFDQQADQIESALTRLALPARVDGGVVRENHVRYHLTPAVGTQPLEVVELAEDVAQEIGVKDVRVLREAGELAIEVPLERASGLGLLPLVHALPRMQPLSAVVGMSRSGQPLLLELEQTASWHVLIRAGAGMGKSELLRTLSISLALASRPAQVGFLGIDLSGRELTHLDSLPHTLTDVATNAEYAEELLQWLVEEMERRMRAGIYLPHLVLFVDDMDRLRDRLGAKLDQLLESILVDGPRSAIHLFAAAREAVAGRGLLARASTSAAWIEGYTEERRGSFHIRCGAESVQADAAWMSASELDSAVRLVRSGLR
jgi:DNA segregation ATPase FtsK/SpoIIIE-like protein